MAHGASGKFPRLGENFRGLCASPDRLECLLSPDPGMGFADLQDCAAQQA